MLSKEIIIAEKAKVDEIFGKGYCESNPEILAAIVGALTADACKTQRQLLAGITAREKEFMERAAHIREMIRNAQCLTGKPIRDIAKLIEDLGEGMLEAVEDITQKRSSSIYAWIQVDINEDIGPDTEGYHVFYLPYPTTKFSGVKLRDGVYVRTMMFVCEGELGRTVKVNEMDDTYLNHLDQPYATINDEENTPLFY